MQSIDKLKSLFTGSLDASINEGLNYIRTLNVNQAQMLIDSIEANAYWENRFTFNSSDSVHLLSYLDKMRMLIENRITKGKFMNEISDDGLFIVRSSTHLTLGEYQRVFLLNTPYIDLVSIDFSYTIYVDLERFRLLTYCEGDITEQLADSLDILTQTIEKTIDSIEKERPLSLIHEPALTKLVKLKASVIKHNS